MPYGHLEELLKETRDLAKENNKLLRRMERNALIGFFAKLILWLIILGVPLFFLSSYIGPILSMFTGNAATPSTGLFGLPSGEELKQIIDGYKGGQQ